MAASAGETITTRIPGRMDRLPWSRWHWLVIFGLGTVWILDGVEVTIVGAIASRLQDKQTLGLSAFDIAFGGTCYIIGAAIGAIGFGYLTDRLGRKKLFIVTLAVYLVATVATAFTWSAASFWIFRALTGLGIGGEYAAINSAIDEHHPRAGARLGRPRDQRLLLARGLGRRRPVLRAARQEPLLDQPRLAAGLRTRRGHGPGHHVRASQRAREPALAHHPRPRGRGREAREHDRGAREARHRNARARRPRRRDRDQAARATNVFEVARTLFKRYPRRSILGFTLIATQAFIYNAVIFTFSIVLTTFFKVSDSAAPAYLIPFGIANFAGALLLGRLFDTVGRRPMIAGTYFISALGLFLLGLLFNNGTLGLGGFMVVLCGTFFFASAAASAGYLTVSEVFPLETRAMAIALFYAISTGIGGGVGPLLFGSLLGTGDRSSLFLGYGIASALMLVAAAVAWVWGVDAEQESLEEIAEPLSATSAEAA
jgi:MFS family permease